MGERVLDGFLEARCPKRHEARVRGEEVARLVAQREIDLEQLASRGAVVIARNLPEAQGVPLDAVLST